jgi:hypothetical protein
VPDADRLILDASTGTRRLTQDEVRRITEGIARAGWDEQALETVRGRLAGLVWQGTPLRGKDRLPPAVTHYLWHVVKQREWPDGTSLDAYTASVRRLILDPASGLFTSLYNGAWQLSVVGASGDLRGAGGSDWVLVEYRVGTGHWVTAYQPDHSLADEVRRPARENVRWLRRSSSTFG